MVATKTHAQQAKDHFAAGAIGLSVSYSCMHPLDTIKTRIQANVASSWRAIFSRETARSLGKGFFVSALGAAGQGGARFSTYEFCKEQMLTGRPKSSPWTIPATAMAAVLGDLASSVIKVPREVITSKLQTDHYGTSGRSNAASHVIQRTLMEEGPRGLFRGFWAIAARDSPFMVILLVSYENFKAFHHKSVRTEWIKQNAHKYGSHPHIVANAAFEEIEADIPTLRSVLYGGISGMLAGYFTTPMDVLRTHMITERSTGPSISPASLVRAAQNVYQRALNQPSTHTSVRSSMAVYRAFFAGAIPRSMWWFGICGIFFPTYETLKSILSNEHH